eukprot:6214567-Pleurochrysis_carterae.AAC.3
MPKGSALLLRDVRTSARSVLNRAGLAFRSWQYFFQRVRDECIACCVLVPCLSRSLNEIWRMHASGHCALWGQRCT